MWFRGNRKRDKLNRIIAVKISYIPTKSKAPSKSKSRLRNVMNQVVNTSSESGDMSNLSFVCLGNYYCDRYANKHKIFQWQLIAGTENFYCHRNVIISQDLAQKKSLE